jgi:hypothetical protein
MAVLAPVVVSLAGVADNLVAAAAGGDSFPNNGHTVFVANNPTGGAITVTFDDPGSQSPASAAAFNPDVAVVVGAGQKRTIGPFPPFRFNDANGRVNVSYSAVGMTVMPLQKLP